MSAVKAALQLVVILSLCFLMALAVWLFWPISTPSIVADNPDVKPISEMRYVELNGVEQWVLIRGENIENPILLVLHGGPGTSEAAFFRAFNSALEESYTVVHWDQRGAGKSYNPAVFDSEISIATYLADLDLLIDHLRSRLSKDKVLLLGHSWGSALGIIYAQSHPEKLMGFVGVGQMSDMVENERRSFLRVLGKAQLAENETAVRELEQVGPPPYDWKGMLVQRKWVRHFGGGQSRHHSIFSLAITALRQSEANALDLFRFIQGEEKALRALWPEIAELDLSSKYRDFEVPIFFLLGRHDGFILPDLAEDYFNQIDAPMKRLIWFENSAHSPPFEEPELFNHVMTNNVRSGLEAAD